MLSTNFQGQWHLNRQTMEYFHSCQFFDNGNGMDHHEEYKCQLHSIGINYHDLEFDLKPEKTPVSVSKIEKQ